MSGNSTDSSKAAPAADPTPLIPAASLKGTAGILDTVSVSLMTLGGLNWLSEAIGTAAGAKSPNMVAGLSSLVGVPQLATFVYLLVGIAAAYFFIDKFVLRIEGKDLSDDDKYFNWGFLGFAAIIAAGGMYGMYA